MAKVKKRLKQIVSAIFQSGATGWHWFLLAIVVLSFIFARYGQLLNQVLGNVAAYIGGSKVQGLDEYVSYLWALVPIVMYLIAAQFRRIFVLEDKFEPRFKVKFDPNESSSLNRCVNRREHDALQFRAEVINASALTLRNCRGQVIEVRIIGESNPIYSEPGHLTWVTQPDHTASIDIHPGTRPELLNLLEVTGMTRIFNVKFIVPEPTNLYRAFDNRPVPASYQIKIAVTAEDVQPTYLEFTLHSRGNSPSARTVGDTVKIENVRVNYAAE